ncbi:MAG: ABC transporter permease, partial [Bacteroidetes bacterium]|nr:ABC transporter permease [Bacteroidota bacterium]
MGASLPVPARNRTTQNQAIMFSNHIKVFWRHIRRQPVYAFINISGLAGGMAACMLILLFLGRELSFEDMHPEASRIVRVLTIDSALGTNNQRVGITQPAVGGNIADAMPEIEAAMRLTYQNQVLLRRGAETPVYAENLRNADPNFFDFFAFPLLAGDPQTALAEPYSLVLTRTLADNLFKGEDPMGQTLTDGNGVDYTMTGILEDLPENTHLNLDALGSLDTVRAIARANQPEGSTQPVWVDSWNMVAMPTYAKLAPGTSLEGLDERGTQFVRDNSVPANFSLTFQPLTDVHLGSTDVIFDPVQNKGDRSTVVVFAAIALLILLIAIVNYLNLSTARSTDRAREVGMRKVAGSTQQQLINQFLSESVFTALAGLMLAFVLARAALPFLNSITGANLSLTGEHLPVLLLLSAGMVLVVGVLAGLYPAFALSSFKPIAVLKGRFKTSRSGQRLRIGLVVFQFALSIALIGATGMVQKQLRYIQERDMGYDREQILLFDMTDQSMAESQQLFREQLLGHTSFTAVSQTGGVPGRTFGRTSVRPEGSSDEDIWIWSAMQAAPQTFPTFGIDIAEGRNFDAARSADAQGVVLINETAVGQLGWENPLERRIYQGPQDSTGLQVIGVVKDFNFAGIHQNIEPLIIFPMATNPGPTVVARIQAGRITDALEAAASVWATVYPDYPFEYSFLDEEFQQIYERDQTTGQVINIFATLAILIACLGLFGLASYSTSQRIKEIGVRKVLGASAPSVVKLLVFDFARWVLVANLFAWPLAWYASSRWLEGFAYRVEVDPVLLVVASVLALTISVVTVLS